MVLCSTLLETSEAFAIIRRVICQALTFLPVSAMGQIPDAEGIIITAIERMLIIATTVHHFDFYVVFFMKEKINIHYSLI